MASYYLKDIPPDVMRKAKRAAKLRHATIKSWLLNALVVLSAVRVPARAGVRRRRRVR